MESNARENVTGKAINLPDLTEQVTKAKTLVNDVIEDAKHKM